MQRGILKRVHSSGDQVITDRFEVTQSVWTLPDQSMREYVRRR